MNSSTLDPGKAHTIDVIDVEQALIRVNVTGLSEYLSTTTGI